MSYKPIDLYDEMPFGKFKGHVVANVIDSDPAYWHWLTGNSPAKFTQDVHDAVEIATDDPEGAGSQ